MLETRRLPSDRHAEMFHRAWKIITWTKFKRISCFDERWKRKGYDASERIDQQLIELVCTFYHRERLALLKCIAALGAQKAYVLNGENDNGFSETKTRKNEFTSMLKSSKR